MYHQSSLGLVLVLGHAVEPVAALPAGAVALAVLVGLRLLVADEHLRLVHHFP